MPPLLSFGRRITVRTQSRSTCSPEGSTTRRSSLRAGHRRRARGWRARDTHLTCDALQRSLSWDRSVCRRCSWTLSWDVLLPSILVAEPVRPAEGSYSPVSMYTGTQGLDGFPRLTPETPSPLQWEPDAAQSNRLAQGEGGGLRG